MNKVMILGRVGQNPEVRYTPNGKAVANLSIATNKKWTDKAGQRHEQTEWHRAVFWGKPAELIAEYVSKGRQVLVEGQLQTRKWTDKNGIDRYQTEILGTQIEFLGNPQQQDSSNNTTTDEAQGGDDNYDPDNLG